MTFIYKQDSVHIYEPFYSHILKWLYVKQGESDICIYKFHSVYTGIYSNIMSSNLLNWGNGAKITSENKLTLNTNEHISHQCILGLCDVHVHYGIVRFPDCDILLHFIANVAYITEIRQVKWQRYASYTHRNRQWNNKIHKECRKICNMVAMVTNQEYISWDRL